MEAALETLESLQAKRKIAVLGDMLELGKYTEEAHGKIGTLASASADILVTVGNRAKIIAASALESGMPKGKVMSFEKVGDAVKALSQMARRGDVILIKGSQSVRMEKVTKELMSDSSRAEKLLVRQSPAWLAKRGIYE